MQPFQPTSSMTRPPISGITVYPSVSSSLSRRGTRREYPLAAAYTYPIPEFFSAFLSFPATARIRLRARSRGPVSDDVCRGDVSACAISTSPRCYSASNPARYTSPPNGAPAYTVLRLRVLGDDAFGVQRLILYPFSAPAHADSLLPTPLRLRLRLCLHLRKAMPITQFNQRVVPSIHSSTSRASRWRHGRSQRNATQRESNNSAPLPADQPPQVVSNLLRAPVYLALALPRFPALVAPTLTLPLAHTNPCFFIHHRHSIYCPSYVGTNYTSVRRLS
ncbi:hypothetical protein B0H10DRAFT_1317280 [Mycena sp. CBHHK59/15]|nr:hypothetical protein B0H10DRAFT_1317280 [Mycena sp. CBHHK59/15]